MYCNSYRQSLGRTGLGTLLTEDALRSILATAGVFVHLDLHRADLQAFPTTDALVLIAFDANQGVIAHGLQKHRYRADVLAEYVSGDRSEVNPKVWTVKQLML